MTPDEPTVCPRCKSGTIQCQDTDRIDYDKYVETWYCEECDCTWDSVFELTFKKIEIYEE